MRRLALGFAPDDLEIWEEKAAILEYLGAMPRDMAERLAADLVRAKIAKREASCGSR